MKKDRRLVESRLLGIAGLEVERDMIVLKAGFGVWLKEVRMESHADTKSKGWDVWGGVLHYILQLEINLAGGI